MSTIKIWTIAAEKMSKYIAQNNDQTQNDSYRCIFILFIFLHSWLLEFVFYDSCGFGFMFTFYPLGIHFKETAKEGWVGRKLNWYLISCC